MAPMKSSDKRRPCYPKSNMATASRFPIFSIGGFWRRTLVHRCMYNRGTAVWAVTADESDALSTSAYDYYLHRAVALAFNGPVDG
jgi:hypothetical protein